MIATAKRRTKAATAEQIEIEAARRGDQTARDSIVARHRRLVESTAYKVSARIGFRHQPEELEGYGYQGLLESLDRFDPAVGVKFSTFAAPRIRFAMLDGLRELDPCPRIARNVVAKLDAAQQTVNDRAASIEDLAAIAGVTEAEAATAAGLARRTNAASLDAVRYTAASGRVVTRGDQLVDHAAPAPEARLERAEFWRQELRGFSQTDRVALLCYFVEGLTMREIGERLGLGESRISQRVTAALERLRQRHGLAQMAETRVSPR